MPKKITARTAEKLSPRDLPSSQDMVFDVGTMRVEPVDRWARLTEWPTCGQSAARDVEPCTLDEIIRTADVQPHAGESERPAGTDGIDVAIALQSRVRLLDLSIQPEGDEINVGSAASGEFFRMPPEAAPVLALLDGSHTLADVADTIRQESGEDLDVLDFASTLLALELVASVDDLTVRSEQKRSVSPVLRRIGSVMFSRPAQAVFGGCAAAAGALMAAAPHLAPRGADIMPFNSPGLSIIVSFVLSWLLLFAHEGAHALAAYRAGVPVRFRLNLRFIWLVAETDMSGLWALPRRARYVPFLAGMMWDSGLLAVTLVAELCGPHAAAPMLRLLVLQLVFNLLWQFVIFLRTDTYFVAVTATGSADLAGNARLALRYLTGFDNDHQLLQWRQLPRFEQRAAHWFAPLLMVGTAVAALSFSVLRLPGMLTMTAATLHNLTSGPAFSAQSLDAAAAMGVGAVGAAAWLVGMRTAVRDWRQRRLQQI
jgi:hypothetical protein